MFPVVLIPLILVIIIAVVAFVILVIPLDLSVIVSRRDGPASLSLSACWSILGLGYYYTQQGAQVHLLMSGKPIYSRDISPAPGVAREISRSGTDVRTMISRICLLQALLPAIFRILRALKRHAEFRRLSCDLVIGTGKPAETGLLFGIFSAVRPLLMVSPQISLSLEPVFDREVLEGDCRIDLRLNRPLVVITLILRLVLSPGTWKVLKKCQNGGIPS